jgi:hypothetical protein
MLWFEKSITIMMTELEYYAILSGNKEDKTQI